MHYKILVIGDNVDDILAPYDQDLQVEPYIEYTKADLIKQWRLDVVKWVYSDEEFERLLTRTDEEVYQDEIKKYEDEEEIDEDGNIICTYNPQSKWDWYVIGGRWSNYLETSDGQVDSAEKKDILNLSDLTAAAVVFEDKWYDIEYKWDDIQYKESLQKHLSWLDDDMLITVVDIHI